MILAEKSLGGSVADPLGSGLGCKNATLANRQLSDTLMGESWFR